MNSTTGPKALNRKTRSEAVQAMSKQELDVLIVGGGVVGAGAALDAASRGLSVGLIEMRDWASGTSSRSSKLIHGGLRYLEMLDFRLVREALTERGLLLEKLAPHLVKPVSFLYPLKHRLFERLYVGMGIFLYDLMSFSIGHGRGLPAHRHLSLRRSLKASPALNKKALVGSILYWDAQVDDARHTMELVRTAATFGAHVASRTKLVEFIKRGNRVIGATVQDLETGDEYEIYAREVINATGVWTEEIQQLAGPAKVNVKASKGIHIVVPRDRIDSKTGVIMRTEKSVLFVIPWGRHWIVGTTDNEWSRDKGEPAITATDIEYLLERVNSVLSRPLRRTDIEGTFAGLRPLISVPGSSTSKLSREHLVVRQMPGLTAIAGGKYTTYRVMAQDIVDLAVAGLGKPVRKSKTHKIPCVGALGYEELWKNRKSLAQEHRLPLAQVERMLNRYGSMAQEIFELMTDDIDLREPVPGTSDYVAAEMVYAVTHEGALHLEDILARRTRLSFESWDKGMAACRFTADLVAKHLEWDAKRVFAEIDSYAQRLEAFAEAATLYDEEMADNLMVQVADGLSRR